jgi:hydroxypyruvate reductase
LAREIFAATLRDIDVAAAFARKVERRGSVLQFGGETLELNAFQKIWVVSFGKAAWATSSSLLGILGQRYCPSRGVVVSNIPVQSVPVGFRAYQGGHPYPDDRSLTAADEILLLAREADNKTLLFFLISGGGSALVDRPLDPPPGTPGPAVSLEDITALNRVLVGSGASIEEINAIRKHLSAIKGGRLAEAAAKAHKVTFLLSDVPEGKWATIASGPTLPDPTTADDCYEIVARRKLAGRFPPSIRELFAAKKLPETPKPGAPAFQDSRLLVLLSSRDVLHAAHRAAGARGFVAECEMSCDDWPLEKAADCLLARLDEMQRENPGLPVCLISAGEILSPVTGPGQGGRNQAFVLHCVERIAGQERAVLSAGTDGMDGSSPAAGAVSDDTTLARAREEGLDPQDYFSRSDSFHFFDALRDTIVTGPQQNNLRDVRLLLAR